jgi:hypothetical protein
MAPTNPDGNPPAGHGGKTVSTNGGKGITSSSDKQRAADIAETNRKANIARGNIAARKSRIATAAKRHIGPLK